VIGGGARSAFWGRLLASVLGRPLDYRAAGELGPAFGAARLARLADTGERPEVVCEPPPLVATIEPEPALAAGLGERLARWRRLYPALRERFAEAGGSGARW
jgi:xylulokinase